MRQMATARQAERADAFQGIGAAMARLGIMPLPRNYELLHEALSGTAPDLTRDLAALGPRPQQGELDALGLHYRLAGHCALTASKAESEAAELLRALKEQISAALSGKRAFGRALELTVQTLREPATSLPETIEAIDFLQSALSGALVAETALGEAFDRSAKRLDRLQRGLQSLDAESMQDRLTQLPNRIALSRRLDGLYATGAMPERGALLLIDVDDFSRINATFGQRAGNRLLKRLSALLRKSIKKSDFLARAGGDDFALLAAGIDQADAVAIATRLRNTIAEELLFATSEPGEGDHLTVSIGMALAAQAANAAELQRQAQAALASAKADTRQPIKLYAG